jgi:hypothetical protein
LLAYSEPLLPERAFLEELRLSNAYEVVSGRESALDRLELLLSLRDQMVHTEDRQVLIRLASSNVARLHKTAQRTHARLTKLLVGAKRPAVAMNSRKPETSLSMCKT